MWAVNLFNIETKRMEMNMKSSLIEFDYHLIPGIHHFYATRCDILYVISHICTHHSSFQLHPHHAFIHLRLTSKKTPIPNCAPGKRQPILRIPNSSSIRFKIIKLVNEIIQDVCSIFSSTFYYSVLSRINSFTT